MKNKIIYTNVEWFSATDDPDKNSIPNKIIEAKNVWNANGGKSTSEICSLVSKFIKCKFIAENFDGWENFFYNKNYGEFCAVKVNVVGVEFSIKNLPLIRAEAWINVLIQEKISEDDLDNWLESEWGLQTGIIWNWEFDGNDGDLDLTMMENSGMEAIWADSIPN
jgi:hypothetical protein